MEEEMREGAQLKRVRIMRKLEGIMKVLKHKVKKTSCMLLVDVSSGLILVKFPKFVAVQGAICGVEVAKS